MLKKISTKIFIIFLAVFVSLPVLAKDTQLELIKQVVFKNAKAQISARGFPQYDNHRVENLHALYSWQAIDDRIITKYGSNRYMIKFDSEEKYKTAYVFNNDGTLAFVDFITYQPFIKSFADLQDRLMNCESIYPYYVYRHDNGGNLNGIWYIQQDFAYFFSKDRNLIYKCDDFYCTDTRTNRPVGQRCYF